MTANWTFGASDLVTAAAEAYRLRERDAEFHAYWATKYHLLREQLDVPFDLLEPFVEQTDDVHGPPDFDGRTMRALLASSIKASCDIPNPFGMFLEGNDLAFELFDRNGRGISELRNDLEAQFTDLANHLLERLVPGVTERTMTWEMLIEAGLPDDAPDSYDDW